MKKSGEHACARKNLRRAVNPVRSIPDFFSNIDGQQVTKCAVSVYSTFYGQAERAISNGKLNVLLRLHIRPINVVVFDGPY
jgi:hypothetical protein